MKALALLVTAASLLFCADTVPSEVPLITGDFGFLAGLQSGHREFGPKFEPIVLLPLSGRLLVEAEYSTELPVERNNGSLGPAVLNHSVEYMQLDYVATNSITVVAGYFATPFGIYKERIDPLWIRNFIDTPLLYAVNDNSSAGVMIRGGLFATPAVKLNYAVSVSGDVENSQFQASKKTTERLSVYLPGARVELGSSFSRNLGAGPYNTYGFDLTYRPKQAPLEIRGEGLWSGVLGNGYWMEGTYRFPSARLGFLRRSQAVLRGESFSPAESAADLVDGLPDGNSKRISLGWNYWIKDAVRASIAYERLWSRAEDTNVLSLALVYRFSLPVGRAQ